MSLVKSKLGMFFLASLFCLLLPTVIYAVNDNEMPLPAIDNPAPSLSSQSQGDGEIDLPITGGEKLYKSPLWGNDTTIATGPVEGGISATYDATSGNMYAARCTTYNSVERRMVKVYKSADGGVTWQNIVAFSSTHSFSLLQLLVCRKVDINRLYVFALSDQGNGTIELYSYNLEGAFQFGGAVANESPDSIVYFSACRNHDGDSLYVAYETHSGFLPTSPWIRFIRSTNQGQAWSGGTTVDADGAQPDIEYGANGWLFLVVQDIEPQHDIQIWRSTNYGTNWSSTMLTSDGWDDSYPKVAALHKTPPNTDNVWVTYNHYTGSKWTLRYAYSTDGGGSWSMDHVLASSESYNYMAPDLFGDGQGSTMRVCYLEHYYLFQIPDPIRVGNIYYAYATSSDPGNWQGETKISDHLAGNDFQNTVLDGRNVCQGTNYPIGGGQFWVWCRGIVYAGWGFSNLYFDGSSWTDVEAENEEEAAPSGFSLSNNYPNPFNPETKIGYSLSKSSQVKLEIFNVLGQRIRTLVDEHQTAANREVVWDGKDENGKEVSSGVYLCKLQAGDLVQTKKMVLIK
jgi:hypothetical protein